MDQALIENAQHEIDAQQRRQDEQPLAGLKTAEHPGIAGKFTADGAGHLHIQLRLLDQLCRFAQRHALAQVEGDGRGRELPLMGDGQRGRCALQPGEGADRHLYAAAPWHEEVVELPRVLRHGRINLQNHAILVARAVNHADLALGEGIVQRLVHRLERDAQPCRRIPVHHQARDQPRALLIG